MELEERFPPTVTDGTAETDNLLLAKSFAFSVRIVNLYRYLLTRPCERPLANQLLRCGTSIGANVEEAVGAFTRREFACKLGIAYKEARETSYWLRLIHRVDTLTPAEFASIYPDCVELCKLLRASLNTLRAKK